MSITRKQKIGVFAALTAGLIAGGLTVANAGDFVNGDPKANVTGTTSYSETDTTTQSGMPINEAINKSLADLGQSPVESASTGRAPNPTVNANASWLVIDISGTVESEEATIEPAWEADLLQGAVTQRSSTSQTAANEVIAGSSIMVALSSGETVDEGAEAGYVALGQTFPNSSTDEEDIARLTETLKTFGLEAQSINIRHPLQKAVAITARMTSPEKTSDWGVDQLRDTLLGDPKSFEGMYLEIQAQDGAPLVRSSVAYRTGVGRLWFAKGADELFHAQHGATPGNRKD